MTRSQEQLPTSLLSLSHSHLSSRQRQRWRLIFPSAPWILAQLPPTSICAEVKSPQDLECLNVVVARQLLHFAHPFKSCPHPSCGCLDRRGKLKRWDPEMAADVRPWVLISSPHQWLKAPHPGWHRDPGPPDLPAPGSLNLEPNYKIRLLKCDLHWMLTQLMGRAPSEKGQHGWYACRLIHQTDKGRWRQL